jgi:lysophospholipase L1-like esterase
LLATVWLIGASAMLLDLLCHALRSVPQLAQGPFAATARFLYRADRATLQFLPTAAQPDPQLGYVLRPAARFVFAETEFADEFTTNSAGLRDREADLAAADVVVLGDSHTLGWGVAQDATFAEVLERTLGRVVLNAGVSSYGTARALRLLERIPARATARVLVIQYSDNDHPENHAFVAAGAVQAMSAEAWRQLSTEAQQRSGYAPGKHVARLALSALDSLLEPFHRGCAWVPANPSDGADVATQARTFLDVLCASPVDLSRYRIVLLGLSEWNAAGDGFVDAVRAQLQTREYPPHLASMRLVPLAERLGPDVWYSLDDHLRAEGHARIAAALAAAIDER